MQFFPLLLIGSVATWYLLRMRSLSNNLNFVIRNINVKGGTILQPNIEIIIGVQNPTAQAAILRSLVGNLEYESRSIAQFSSFEKITIQGNTETIIKVTAIPNVFAVIKIVREILINRQPGKVINISGKANVNNVTIPFNSSFQF